MTGFLIVPAFINRGANTSHKSVVFCGMTAPHDLGTFVTLNNPHIILFSRVTK